MSEPVPAYKREDVLKIINSVLDKAGETSHVCVKAIAPLLRELKEILGQMRAELGTSGQDSVSEKEISDATDELDAVIKATAEATGTIMDSSEEIEKLIAGMDPETGAKVQEAVTKIYEACSFQDITGQRITKVLGTLRHIEHHVNAIIDIVGVPDSTGTVQAAVGEDSLLNGPQLPEKAVSQDDIDKILADFD